MIARKRWMMRRACHRFATGVRSGRPLLRATVDPISNHARRAASRRIAARLESNAR